MILVQSPRKKGQKPNEQSPEKRKPKPPPFFAPKGLAGQQQPDSSIPSSSPAFGTPVHPLRPFNVGPIRPFNVTAPAKAAILPILLPPATLRPLAFRTFTKKHSLTLTSSALQELATFIGRHCGSGWREEGLAEKVLEEVAKSWKQRNGGVIVEGSSAELKDILKTLEGNMSGGKIITGARGLTRQNSLMLEPSQDPDFSKTRLGLRPAMGLMREESQSSMGMSGLTVEEEQDDEELSDPRRWLKVIDAYSQPQFTYNVKTKHFERLVTSIQEREKLELTGGQRKQETIIITASPPQDQPFPQQVQCHPPTPFTERVLPNISSIRSQRNCLPATVIIQCRPDPQDHANSQPPRPSW